MTLTELFSNPSRWCQDYLAKEKSGKGVNPSDKYAVSWCLGGGLIKCYPDLPVWLKSEVQHRINAYLRVDSFVTWNDNPERTIEDIQKVAKVIDELIEDMKAERGIE